MGRANNFSRSLSWQLVGGLTRETGIGFEIAGTICIPSTYIVGMIDRGERVGDTLSYHIISSYHHHHLSSDLFRAQ